MSTVFEKTIWRFEKERFENQSDQMAIESPMEIRLCGEQNQSIAITMRTPGNDIELALGFLYGEAILSDFGQVEKVQLCGKNKSVVSLHLRAEESLDLQKLKRNFYTTSSCGVCGKASIEAIFQELPEWTAEQRKPFEISVDVLRSLPQTLRKSQPQFAQTGGLHAVASFSKQGELLQLREDVGRHNALDKLVGHYFEKGQLPRHDDLLLLSGRASFELIQKAAMAGFQLVGAIGAPSSLAIEMADRFDMTLVGFLRSDRMNVYSHPQRIIEWVQ